MVRAWRDPKSVPCLAMGGSNGPPIALAQRFRTGTAQMNKSDKACSLMERNDNRRNSFLDVRQILLFANI
jgi:hypothetical protein